MPASRCFRWVALDARSHVKRFLPVVSYPPLTDPQDLASSHGNGEAIPAMCPNQHEAKKFFNKQRTAGTLVLILIPHAEEELSKDDMDVQDCMNILRAGVWDPPEWENGRWRYPARTQRMAIVIEIDFERSEFTIITGWRKT